MPEPVPDRFRLMLCAYDAQGRMTDEVPEIHVYAAQCGEPLLTLEASDVALTPRLDARGLRLWLGGIRANAEGGYWAALKAYATHVGNIHWLEVEVSAPHAFGLLTYVRLCGLYSCTEGEERAFAWWNTAPRVEAVTAEALGFYEPPAPVPGLDFPDPHTFDLFAPSNG